MTRRTKHTDLMKEAAAGGGRATIFLAIRRRRRRRRRSSAGWDRCRGAVPGDEERREGRPETSSAAAEDGDRMREDGERPVRAGPGHGCGGGDGRAAEERRGRDKPLHGAGRCVRSRFGSTRI
jgi:hypothetical protein